MTKPPEEYATGERLYLGYGEASEEKDHIDRYQFAAQHLDPSWAVLDAASGSGYGAELLAEYCGSVTGLEMDDHALAYARKHHQTPKVTFLKQDLNAIFQLPDASFDAVVSFETFEHIANQDGLLAEFKRVLKPSGIIIISTPDKDILTGKTHAENPFHIQELSKKEFLDMLSKFFSVEEIYGQLKYVSLPLWKRGVKAAAKLDVFKLKRYVTKKLDLQKSVHTFFNQTEETPIERVTAEQKSHFHAIAIAKQMV